MCGRVWVCAYEFRFPRRSEEFTLDSPKQDLQAIVSHSTCVLKLNSCPLKNCIYSWTLNQISNSFDFSLNSSPHPWITGTMYFYKNKLLRFWTQRIGTVLNHIFWCTSQLWILIIHTHFAILSYYLPFMCLLGR